VSDAAQVAHDRAEAMVQRYRNHHAVVDGEAEALADPVAIIEEIAVAEGGAFGAPVVREVYWMLTG